MTEALRWSSHVNSPLCCDSTA